MGETINELRQKTGELLIWGGNVATKFRDKTSPYYGVYVALTEESLESTIFYGVEVASDGLDGTLVRSGSKLLGIDTTDEGAIADPKADKKLVNSTELGLVFRYIRHQDYTGFAVLAVNYVVSKWRDQRMQNDRDLALQMDYDPKAIGVNKVKSGLQFLGQSILVSRLAKQELYKKIGLGIISAGTILGVVGENIYRGRVQSHMYAIDAAIAAGCPDEVAIIVMEPVSVQETDA